MKILYVVSRPLEINTSASIRNRATILGLVDNGHEVEVLTTEPDRNHPAFDGQMSVDDVARMHYVKLGGSQRIARMGRKFSFLRPIKDFAYRWMTRHEIYDNLKGIVAYTDAISLQNAQYDLIISSSDPKSSHLFVMKLLEKQKEAFQGNWIQIWGDPFLADITQTNKNSKLIKAEERRLIHAADLVFYVSRLTMNQQKMLYPEYSRKMRYTPIPYIEEHLTKNRKLSASTELNLAYCGDYSPTVRNLVPLYDTVNNNAGLRLVICGDSTEPLSNTQNVVVRGRVSFETVRSVENEADILVFLANRKGAQIPGKIYQYAGTNKPVLFILDGDENSLKEQFEHYGRFIFTRNTSVDILQALRYMISNDIEYKPLKDFSKEYIMEQFMIEVEESV